MMTTDWEDRATVRTSMQVDTPVLDTRTGRFVYGRSRDVSEGGVFVETNEQPPVGALVEVFLGGVGIGTQVLGRVVRTVPGEGFGAKFTGDTSGVASLLR